MALFLILMVANIVLKKKMALSHWSCWCSFLKDVLKEDLKSMSSVKTVSDDFNIFVAGKTGAFKGIKVDNKTAVVKNLQNVQILKPENEISIINWNDKEEKDILIGTVNQVVKVYDIEFKAYSSSLETKIGSGPLVGLTRFNGAITTCSQSGHIKVWKYSKGEELELPTGGQVNRMQRYNGTEGIVATGGHKNDLKVWDLKTKKTVFCAKNVKKDMLELEIPIWVSDLTFFPNTEFKIAVATRHGQIRLYDTKAQRRPVIDIKLEERALNTISLCYNENQVVVGSATGHILLADLRCKGKILHAYKGAVGSIRQIAAHPTMPYIASVGLDRYMRIHHLESKKLIHQQYLKVRLNCVLMKSSFGHNVEDDSQEDNGEEKIDCVDLVSDEEYTAMFDNMESVGDKVKEPLKKKTKKK